MRGVEAGAQGRPERANVFVRRVERRPSGTECGVGGRYKGWGRGSRCIATWAEPDGAFHGGHAAHITCTTPPPHFKSQNRQYDIPRGQAVKVVPGGTTDVAAKALAHECVQPQSSEKCIPGSDDTFA
eukprot:1147697-Prorocentrum_minimum.AAC.2